MAYFKDDKDGYYVIENNSNSNLIEISHEEYLIANQPTPPTLSERKAAKQAQIDAIESANLCGRKYREGFLLSCEREATALGKTLAEAYTLNPGYRGAKDVDDRIKALRAELKAII